MDSHKRNSLKINVFSVFYSEKKSDKGSRKAVMMKGKNNFDSRSPETEHLLNS